MFHLVEIVGTFYTGFLHATLSTTDPSRLVKCLACVLRSPFQEVLSFPSARDLKANQKATPKHQINHAEERQHRATCSHAEPNIKPLLIEEQSSS